MLGVAYLQDDPEGPCGVGEDHEERSFDPRYPARNIAVGGLGDGEGAVGIHGAERRPGVEGEDEDAGEAERYAGDLGLPGKAPQPHHLHPQQ